MDGNGPASPRAAGRLGRYRAAAGAPVARGACGRCPARRSPGIRGGAPEYPAGAAADHRAVPPPRPASRGRVRIPGRRGLDATGRSLAGTAWAAPAVRRRRRVWVTARSHPGTVGTPGTRRGWLTISADLPGRRKWSEGRCHHAEGTGTPGQRRRRLFGGDLGLELLFPLGERDVALLKSGDLEGPGGSETVFTRSRHSRPPPSSAGRPGRRSGYATRAPRRGPRLRGADRPGARPPAYRGPAARRRTGGAGHRPCLAPRRRGRRVSRWPRSWPRGYRAGRVPAGRATGAARTLASHPRPGTGSRGRPLPDRRPRRSGPGRGRASTARLPAGTLGPGRPFRGPSPARWTARPGLRRSLPGQVAHRRSLLAALVTSVALRHSVLPAHPRGGLAAAPSPHRSVARALSGPPPWTPWRHALARAGAPGRRCPL